MADQIRRRVASRHARSEFERARDLRWTGFAAVLGGAGLAVSAILIKSVILALTGVSTGYFILVAMVILAAWIGGARGGLTAILVGFVVNNILFIAPVGGLISLASDDVIRQVLFVVVSVTAVGLFASQRAARDRVASALRESGDLAESIEARDERLEMMLAASGMGFWEWDVVTGRLDWSDAIFRQHGLDPDAGSPDFTTYLATIHPEDRPRFEAAVADALAGRAAFSIEFRVLRPDGTVTWTHGIARVYRDADGHPIRMLGTGQDITERKHLAEEREAMVEEERLAAEFRDAFVDVISHELRTPVTTILGLTDILVRDGGADPRGDRASLLEDVRAESERLHRLVEDLLVLGRVERGRLTIDAEPLQVRRLLATAVEHEQIALPSIRIRYVAADDLPIVTGEASYVEQVVRNLLENAAKYAPTGSEVVVRLTHHDEGVLVVVEDHGSGVPVASQPHIFDLFYRDPASARTVSGSGIGLFVCASLVAAMGGTIEVHDTPGGGATFGFTLRAAEADHEPEVEVEVAPPVDDLVQAAP